MPQRGRRSGATLTALALLASLLVVACGGHNGLDEANRLNQGASEEIREIEKIVRENKGKESEVTRALNADDMGAARRLLDESVAAIDRGLERAESAADKFERASKLDVDPTIKEYLSLRAQSVAKAIEAFRELRRGIIVFREALGSSDKVATERAKGEIQQSSVKFDGLISESEKLQRRADEIARRNPDTIKPG
ncbi:MAG TPA: hypothetical protein VJT09_19190 [Pyrinomonadaceae bacterium]|nr:hypothetical protein [Pyrinomonadaceae bacterium]